MLDPTRDALMTRRDTVRASSETGDALLLTPGPLTTSKRVKEVMVHDMVQLFAQAAGVEPEMLKRPELAKALLFGPLSPVQFRMDGHGKLHDAAERFAEAVAEFGCVTNLQFDPHELKSVEMLAANLKEERWLPELLEKVR